MVVIAIIAILAAILFPVFARARENAQRASCQSNLKQIGLGVLQYVQDYDEKFPPLAINVGGSDILWFQELQPYAKSTQVFLCPSDSDRTGVGFGTNPAPSGYVNPFHTGYGYNCFGASGKAQSEVQFAATTILMTDCGSQAAGSAPLISETSSAKPRSSLLAVPNGIGTNNYYTGATQNDATNGDWAAPAVRHLGTVNVAFMDGHVKAMKPEKFYFTNTTWFDPAVGGS